MVCFLIGHRDAGEWLMPRLKQEILRHIVECGVTEFVVGQYGAFDRMAARAVIDAKRRYPEVKLSILLPYHPSERAVQAPDGYDNTIYPPGMETVPRRVAIVRANEYMIQHCDCLIAYAWQPGSNTLRLLKMAQRGQRVRITELGEYDR